MNMPKRASSGTVRAGVALGRGFGVLDGGDGVVGWTGGMGFGCLATSWARVDRVVTISREAMGSMRRVIFTTEVSTD